MYSVLRAKRTLVWGCSADCATCQPRPGACGAIYIRADRYAGSVSGVFTDDTSCVVSGVFVRLKYGRSSQATTSAWYSPRTTDMVAMAIAKPTGSHLSWYVIVGGAHTARKMQNASTRTTPVPSVWRRRNPRSMKASVTDMAGGQNMIMGIHVERFCAVGSSTGVYQHTTRIESSVAIGRPVSRA